MDTYEVLVAARDLIADEEHWTQNSFAKDATGAGIQPGSPDAVQFCAYGAVEHVAAGSVFAAMGTHDLAAEDAIVTLSWAARTKFDMDVIGVNDTLDHEAVMGMFHVAIESRADG